MGGTEEVVAIREGILQGDHSKVGISDLAASWFSMIVVFELCFVLKLHREKQKSH